MKIPYRIKEHSTIRVSPSQELVNGRLWVDGHEYVAIRERVPGDEDTKGVFFPARILRQEIEALEALEAFMNGGPSEPSPDQASLPGLGR